MKNVILAVLVGLLVFVAACGKGNDQPTTPVVPAAPEQNTPTQPETPSQPTTDVKPAETDAKSVATGTDKVLGEVEKQTALQIDSVRCDVATSTLTFRFANKDTKVWQLDQSVSFGNTKIVPVRVFLNNYEMNGRPYYRDGVRYFGPKEKFSDNCGGVAELNPGEDVTCTVSPFPQEQTTELKWGNQQIFIDTPAYDHSIPFKCE